MYSICVLQYSLHTNYIQVMPTICRQQFELGTFIYSIHMTFSWVRLLRNDTKKELKNPRYYANKHHQTMTGLYRVK